MPNFVLTMGSTLNVNELSFHLGEYEKMKEISFDPYLAVRDGFYQLRRQSWQTADSRGEFDDLSE